MYIQQEVTKNIFTHIALVLENITVQQVGQVLTRSFSKPRWAWFFEVRCRIPNSFPHHGTVMVAHNCKASSSRSVEGMQKILDNFLFMSRLNHVYWRPLWTSEVWINISTPKFNMVFIIISIIPKNCMLWLILLSTYCED